MPRTGLVVVLLVLLVLALAAGTITGNKDQTPEGQGQDAQTGTPSLEPQVSYSTMPGTPLAYTFKGDRFVLVTLQDPGPDNISNIDLVVVWLDTGRNKTVTVEDTPMGPEFECKKKGFIGTKAGPPEYRIVDVGGDLVVLQRYCGKDTSLVVVDISGERLTLWEPISGWTPAGVYDDRILLYRWNSTGLYARALDPEGRTVWEKEYPLTRAPGYIVWAPVESGLLAAWLEGVMGEGWTHLIVAYFSAETLDTYNISLIPPGTIPPYMKYYTALASNGRGAIYLYGIYSPDHNVTRLYTVFLSAMGQPVEWASYEFILPSVEYTPVVYGSQEALILRFWSLDETILVVYEPDTGKIAEYRYDRNNITGTPVFYDSGTIYLLQGQEWIVWLDPATGETSIYVDLSERGTLGDVLGTIIATVFFFPFLFLAEQPDAPTIYMHSPEDLHIFDPKTGNLVRVVPP